jgi:hypothetical protein
MQFNQNMFVGPQFPEIGWDAIPEGHIQQNDHGHDQFLGHGNGEEVDEVEQESMVLDPLDDSDSSVNAAGNNNEMDMILFGNFQRQPQHDQVLQVGIVQTVYGPVLPPKMLWTNLFSNMMPHILSSKVPVSLSSISFGWVIRSWQEAFSDDVSWKITVDQSVQTRKMVVPRRGVARALQFESESQHLVAEDMPSFSASPVTVKKKRTRKAVTPLVQPEGRRFTRSCLKSDGFRPPLIRDSTPKAKKKKIRAKLLIVPADTENLASGNSANDNAEQLDDSDNVPATPISVMQNVGVALGIPRQKLTREQLEADLDGAKPHEKINGE